MISVTSNNVNFAVLLAMVFLAATSASTAQCMLPEQKLLSRRDSTYQAVLHARHLLAAHDVALDMLALHGATDGGIEALNEQRGEILSHAMSAYFFAGYHDYPADDRALMEMLTGLDLDTFDNLTWPVSLDVLVECGILPHLPRSPYEDSRFLSSLPEEPRPGDVFYMPLAAKTGFWKLEAGLYEGDILVIFGKAHDFSSFLSDEQIAIEHPGIAHLIPAGMYTTISYVYGEAPNGGILEAAP